MSRQIISATLLLALGTLSSVIVSDASPAPETAEVILAEEANALLNESPITIAQPDAGADVKSVVATIVTAYSSEVAQTDDTPYITASGTRVRQGVVAANWLPIGTKVRIPDLFGDQVFVVEDRMHSRHTNRLDVWFPTRAEAVQFGARKAQIEIL
ncbi:MAG: 3D domain-containing protein [Candidatus Colwellbacteria bacterium]|nr:3D domain-containing protein [Candidatus Colwellbacteria bacterium]